MRKFLFFLVLLLMIYSNAYGAEVSSSFNFQVTTTSGCTVQGNPALNINHIATQEESISSVTIQFICSANTNYVFSVGAGSNESNNRRRAAVSGNYVTYRLFWDNAYSDEIMTNSNNSKAGTATGGIDSKTIYSKVLRSDNPNPATGRFTDTVRITIAW